MKYKFSMNKILYINNKLSESNSNSTKYNEGELDDSMMEYKCKCYECVSDSMMNDNIKCECDI